MASINKDNTAGNSNGHWHYHHTAKLVEDDHKLGCLLNVLITSLQNNDMDIISKVSDQFLSSSDNKHSRNINNILHSYKDNIIEAWMVILLYGQAIINSDDSCVSGGLFGGSNTTNSRYENSARQSDRFTNKGLGNLGNSCYMSAVIIQVISNIPSFNHYFLSGGIENDYIGEGNSDTTKSLSKCIHSLHIDRSQESLQQDYSVFKQAIGSQHQSYHGNSQQDAQEFLSHLLDCVKRDANRATSSTRRHVEWGQRENESSTEAVNRIKNDIRLTEDSVVNDVFTSLEQSTVRCCNCGHTSIQYTNQDLIALPISYSCSTENKDGIITGEPTTIDELVAHYFDEEDIDFKCTKCDGNNATKKLQIADSPEILITHLKRFKYSEIATERAKINSQVAMSVDQNLDLSSFIAEGIIDTPEYKLVAIITHRGSYDGGHYTTSIFDDDNNEWRVYDDGIVNVENDSENVIDGDSYLAFWQKSSVVSCSSSYQRWPYDALSNVELDYSVHPDENESDDDDTEEYEEDAAINESADADSYQMRPVVLKDEDESICSQDSIHESDTASEYSYPGTDDDTDSPSIPTRSKRSLPPSAELMNRQSNDKMPPLPDLFAPGSSTKKSPSPTWDHTHEDGKTINCGTRMKQVGKRMASSAKSTASRAGSTARSVRDRVSSATSSLLSPIKKKAKKSKKKQSKKKSTKKDKLPGEDKGRQRNAENRQDIKKLLNAPDDIDANLTTGKYCPICIAIYLAVLEHWEVVKDCRYKDGSFIYWNFPRLPWDQDLKSSCVFALILNYCSIEEAGSLRNNEHSGFKAHSDGVRLVSSTWNWIKDMLGMEIYQRMIQLDVDCFAYYAYKTPESIMDKTTLTKIRKSYSKVLKVVEANCVLSLLSTASYENYAKWVHGDEDKFQIFYQDNAASFVSAEMEQSSRSPPKYIPGVHPCTFYNKMKNNPVSLPSRSINMDNMGTNIKRQYTGNSTEECDYCQRLSDTDSPAFKAAYAAAIKSCKLGYKNAVNETFEENIQDCLKYCKKAFPDVVKGINDIKYEHKKSYFASRGYNAAVVKVFKRNINACIEYCKKAFPDIENVNDITFENMSSFFASRGHNGSVIKTFNNNKKEGITWCINNCKGVKSVDDITFENMSSFFASQGYNGSVIKTFNNNKKEGITWCINNCKGVKSADDITFDHMSSYFGSRAAAERGKNIDILDPERAMQNHGYKPWTITTLSLHYRITYLAKFITIYENLLQSAAPIDGSLMPMSTFVEVTMKFVHQAYTDLPDGWERPETVIRDTEKEKMFTIKSTTIPDIKLAVTPNTSKKLAQHLVYIIIKHGMEKNGPNRFGMGGTSNKVSLSYLIIYQVLLQDNNELASYKLYKCPKGHYRIINDSKYDGKTRIRIVCPKKDAIDWASGERRTGCGVSYELFRQFGNNNGYWEIQTERISTPTTTNKKTKKKDTSTTTNKKSTTPTTTNKKTKKKDTSTTTNKKSTTPTTTNKKTKKKDTSTTTNKKTKEKNDSRFNKLMKIVKGSEKGEPSQIIQKLWGRVKKRFNKLEASEERLIEAMTSNYNITDGLDWEQMDDDLAHLPEKKNKKKGKEKKSKNGRKKS